MSANKKATHIVTHKKFYLAVSDKLQHVPAGTEIALDDEVGKRLCEKGRVMKIGEKKAVDLTSSKNESK